MDYEIKLWGIISSFIAPNDNPDEFTGGFLNYLNFGFDVVNTAMLAFLTPHSKIFEFIMCHDKCSFDWD